MTTFAERYAGYADRPPIADVDDSDLYDAYQSWEQAQPERPQPPAAPVFRADPSFRFYRPHRSCGVVGPPLGKACGGCYRCLDRAQPASLGMANKGK
ncbi:hypothetical protein [Thiocystis violacea]|uniref:hypothetical protein n=1 Tax=Thiocystis violacea TaxID=13725 RepID=UPI0019078C7A|nr:hypothetical protein [Thiocystis violacea]MBK1718529.1 hypothetical protein [Thiocystis violacea]